MKLSRNKHATLILVCYFCLATLLAAKAIMRDRNIVVPVAAVVAVVGLEEADDRKQDYNDGSEHRRLDEHQRSGDDGNYKRAAAIKAMNKDCLDDFDFTGMGMELKLSVSDDNKKQDYPASTTVKIIGSKSVGGWQDVVLLATVVFDCDNEIISTVCYHKQQHHHQHHQHHQQAAKQEQQHVPPTTLECDPENPSSQLRCFGEGRCDCAMLN
jgi:hypothetical protein